MSIQVLKAEPSGLEKFLGQTGAGVGLGLGGLIGNYFSQKKSEKAFAGLGLKPEEAKSLSKLPPELQKLIVKKKVEDAQRKELMKSVFPQAGASAEPSELSFQEQQAAPPERDVLGDEQIASISLMDPNFGKILQEQKKSAIKQQQFEHQSTEKYREKIGNLQESMPNQEMALKSMEDAIKSGKLGKGSMNYWTDVLADYSGIESFRNLKSLEGAKFLAGQKSMYSDMREIFPGQIRVAELTLFNQFLPQLGRSKEANLGVLEMLKAKHEMSKYRVDAYNAITRANKGYAPIDIQRRVDEATKGKSAEIMAGLKEKLNQLNPDSKAGDKNTILMKDPSGNLRRVNKADVNKALKAKYTREN